MKLLPKLLLWLLAANLLSLTITLAVVVPVLQNLQPQYSAEQQAMQAVDILHSGGKPAFRAWLRHRRGPENGRGAGPRTGHGMLYNANGEPVYGGRSGRRLSWQPQLNEMLNGRSELSLPGGATLVAATVLDASGAEWRWVEKLRPPPKPPLKLLLIRTAIASLLLLLAAWFTARRLSRPIASLQQVSRQLAAGKLASRVPPEVTGGRDEVAELGRDFNHMADRLQQSLEGHQRLLADVSHELRSPLGRLQLAVELARTADQATAEALLDRIATEGDRLEAMIADVLTISRLEAATPKRQRMAIAPLLAELIEDAEFEAGAAAVTIHCIASEIDADTLLEADPELVRRALENVLRNAVRYSPKGGRVQVLAKRADGMLQVVIEDQGPGVPEAELARMFEPFYRVGEARDRAGIAGRLNQESGLDLSEGLSGRRPNHGSGQGFGLGLAIAARAVQAHAGNIIAEHNVPLGLRVVVTLPLASANGNTPVV